jgi:hypothetical protein
LGKSKKARKSLVLEASMQTAYREGKWLIIPPRKNQKSGVFSEYQLYNLKSDISQKENVAKTKTKVLEKMKSNYLEAIVK